MWIDWTPHAEADLVAIHDDIADDPPANPVRGVNL